MAPNDAQGGAPEALKQAEQHGQRRSRKKPSNSAVLLALAEQAELFRNTRGVTYADLTVISYNTSHRETWPIESKGFRRWLTRIFYIQTRRAPTAQDIKSAINVIDAKASVEAIVREVHVRVGSLDGKIYIDLCNDKWQAVMIDASGWKVVDRPSARFRRAAGMLPLPAPERGGSIEELRPFLNVRSREIDATDSDFVLAIAWLLGALRDIGPFPVYAVMGEHDSAKTTTCRNLVMLCDPNVRDLGTFPRTDQDLFIGAGNRHVQGYENVSYIPEWLSDVLCMLSTGGGHGTRTLYYDDEETIFAAKRPVIFNSIENVVTRADLADRCIFQLLESMQNEARRTERVMKAAFAEAQPRIMGALFDAMADGLKYLPTVQLKEPPRMADFAEWVVACELGGALWEPGMFMRAYAGNRYEATATMVKADPVADAVHRLIVGNTGIGIGAGQWKGTATELLSVLSGVAGTPITKTKTWPTTASLLSNRLRRAARALRAQGIGVDLGDRTGHGRTRLISIRILPGDREREGPLSGGGGDPGDGPLS